jgi:hypothetical protein
MSENARDQADTLRLWFTFGIATVGIVAVLIAFFVAVFVFKGAENPGELIPAVLGTVTAAVGTLAGLVAGHSAGSAGKERAERRSEANEQEASAGKALAVTLQNDESALASGGGTGREAFGVGPSEPGADVIRRHADLARKLFPDVEMP